MTSWAGVAPECPAVETAGWPGAKRTGRVKDIDVGMKWALVVGSDLLLWLKQTGKVLQQIKL